MAEWWTYAPSDFLLFSPRVFRRLVETHNFQFQPLQAATLAFGAWLAVVAWRGARGWRPALLGLSALSLFVAWSFLWSRYATINWAAQHGAAAFAVEAALLAAAMAGAPQRKTGAIPVLGAAIVALGVVVHPALPALAGRPWVESQVFGLFADPTAIVTIGIAAALGGWRLLALAPIPILWALYGAMTAWSLNSPEAGPLLGAALLGGAVWARAAFGLLRDAPPGRGSPTA